MSLYGRRPSVVRSLVSCTSLMTTPSIETIILGMMIYPDLMICYVAVRQAEPKRRDMRLRFSLRQPPAQQYADVITTAVALAVSMSSPAFLPESQARTAKSASFLRH